MKLSQKDFVALGDLDRLRALVLVGTNVSDDDLSHLKQCKRLDHPNLTSTEVTDLAAKLGRAVYHMLSQQTRFDEKRFFAQM